MKNVPLALVVIMLLYTTVDWVMTDFEIGLRLGAGYAVGIFATVFYFINKRISNIVLGAGLLLATVNVIAFTTIFVKIGAGLSLFSGNLELAVQLLPLIVLVFFLVIHWQSIVAWMNKDGL